MVQTSLNEEIRASKQVLADDKKRMTRENSYSLLEQLLHAKHAEFDTTKYNYRDSYKI